MNRRKHYLYNPQEYTKTIDLWLKKYKGKKIIWLEKHKRILGIRTLPKRKHRRSLAIRNLKRLYNYTFTELLCAEMEFDDGVFDSNHCIDYECVKKHRVYAYHY